MLYKVAQVLPDIAIDSPLDYLIPDELLGQVRIGMRASIPIRGKETLGYIVALKEKSEFPNLKPLHSLLASHELLTSELFELAVWMAQYYLCPLRHVLKVMLPSLVRSDGKKETLQKWVNLLVSRPQAASFCESIRQKKSSQALILDVLLKRSDGISLSELLEETGVSVSPVETLAKEKILEIKQVSLLRSPLAEGDFFPTKPKNLNPQQKDALEKIIHSLDNQTFCSHLLYGVTGSGKTEVYLQAISHTLSLGKSALLLVPEISLTPQTIERIRSRFEGKIAVLHHRLSDKERHDEWHKIYRGDAKIAIGARSCVFSPLPNLGLIIIDEEHEPSYKQTEHLPCYHARDVAVMRAYLNKATIVLGSATPSFESYKNALDGKYVLSLLSTRASDALKPAISIVDMRREHEKNPGRPFSDALLKGIEERYKKGEQTILFLNRRGYHTQLLCPSCGWIAKCPHCDVPLTFHYKKELLLCHLCSYEVMPPPTQCLSCKGPALKFKGVGTEQIERILHAILPDVRTLRIDADTTKHKGSHERLLRDFRTAKADVLIGTQMIAKGLHFPLVTLVGILNCDNALNLPDFRASENVFQLITQVSGRAGRSTLPGEVLLQTMMPESHVIQHALNQDFEAFYQEEIESRKAFFFPPFSHLIKFNFSSEDSTFLIKEAEKWLNNLKQHLPKASSLYPLSPAGHPKIKNRYRFHALLITKSITQTTQSISQYLKKTKLPSSISLFIDVDPNSTFF